MQTDEDCEFCLGKGCSRHIICEVCDGTGKKLKWVEVKILSNKIYIVE